ncbi:hypothetical protein [Lysobacter xanthus]
MADGSLLTPCEACGERRSIRATACPRCGHPNARATRSALVGVGVLVVVMAVLLALRFIQLRGH